LKNLQTRAESSIRGDNRGLYKITIELAGQHNKQQKVILDKNGELLVSNDDQLKRWKEF
jgi:hypothetical protein